LVFIIQSLGIYATSRLPCLKLAGRRVNDEHRWKKMNTDGKKDNPLILICVHPPKSVFIINPSY